MYLFEENINGAGLIADSDEKLRPIIPRVGGKTKLADKIIKLFPPDTYIKTYVELFVGGGSIFFKKKSAQINIINDLDKDIYDIYNDINKVDSIDDFDFRGNENKFYKLKNEHPKNPKNRLFRNLYLSNNSMFGNRQSYTIRHSNVKSRGIILKTNYQFYREKMAKTIILNEDYKKVIKKYDKSDTLFYLDPPYSEQKTNWGYNQGLSITPNELLMVLRKIKGYFLMSYDYSLENKKMFEKYFKVQIVKTRYNTIDNFKTVKEMIIMNY